MANNPIHIGQLSQTSETTVRALHFYEKRGLIAPIGRDANGYRLFDSEIVEHIRLIRMMLSIGLSLRTIRDIFAPDKPLMHAVDDATLRLQMSRAREAYLHRIDELDMQIAQLRRCRRDLQSRVEYVSDEMRRSRVRLASPVQALRRVRPGRIEYLTPTHG